MATNNTPTNLIMVMPNDLSSDSKHLSFCTDTISLLHLILMLCKNFMRCLHNYQAEEFDCLNLCEGLFFPASIKIFQEGANRNCTNQISFKNKAILLLDTYLIYYYQI